MKTMERLVKRFNRLYEQWYYVAKLDKVESYAGYYVIYITDPIGITNRYTFTTCDDFRSWMNGIVMD